MKEEILISFTLSVVVISLIAFAIALLSRLIFENKYLKYKKHKRTLSQIVPILVAFSMTAIANVLYFTLIKLESVAIEIVGCFFFSLFIALFLYLAITQGFVKIKKAISERLRLNRTLSKDTIKLLKAKIVSLTREINVCKNDLKIIADKTSELNKLKEILRYDNSAYISNKLVEIDYHIQNLKIDEKDVKEDIYNKSQILENYTKMLYTEKPRFASVKNQDK